jgi:23S rRNA (uracil1939-C5)-methyltransferase
MHVSDLTIEQLGPKGDGVSVGPGGRVYVDRTIPGDRVKARIRKDELGISRGEVVGMVRPSPYRQKPPCEHYDRCGNCTLQHLDDRFYREWKTWVVQEALQKVRLTPQRWLPPVFLGGGNRRRVTFTAQRGRQKLVVGYYRRRSQEVADIASCLVADPKLLELRDGLRPFLSELMNDGQTVDVFLQRVNGAIDMVITGPVGRKGEPDAKVRQVVTDLAKALAVSRVSWRPHEKDELKQLVSRSPVIASFGELAVKLPPAAFLQPTVPGERALVDAVMKALPARGKFADLFSGCGTFAGPMLARGSVDAYEAVPLAVQALEKAAGELSLKGFRRDLFRNPLRRDELNRYDAVVFDPPRGGCPEQVTAMASSRVPTLIGVSCNPATFARDGRILVNGGYRLQTLQCVDQFVWSHHVEVVGVFTKPKRSK